MIEAPPQKQKFNPNPGPSDIYPPGQTPWEIANAEAVKDGQPFELVTADSSYDQSAPLPRLGNLTGFELFLVYAGSFSPVIKRIEHVPEGEARDRLIDRYQTDIGHAEDAIHANEMKEGADHVKLGNQIDALRLLSKKLYEYYWAE
ncbi:MAG: hypothetical protein RIR73_1677 [Chloroflexota bacterium]|jgi:hypothetical protein